MIKSLRIKNYLIIEDTELSFDDGFTVITGETGAGKTILLDAISLLLGKRADTDVLLDKRTKSIIEANFLLPEHRFKELFTSFDLDFDPSSIIRREILPEGKSRAFVNDTPVTLSTLKTIGEQLVDIHTQNSNLALGKSAFRVRMVDTAAATTTQATDYRRQYEHYRRQCERLAETQRRYAEAVKDSDYYKFQAEQISSLDLNDDDELAHLEAQTQMLENATEIKTVLAGAEAVLSEGDICVDGLLRGVRADVVRLSHKYPHADELAERLESVLIELADIADQLSSDSDAAEVNPELLEHCHERMDAIYKLLQKHSVDDIASLRAKLREFTSFVSNVDELSAEIKTLEADVERERASVLRAASALSASREQAFATIEQRIATLLHELGMQHAVFKIDNHKSDEPGLNGIDDISFLFSANMSIEPQPLERVASGGEFSRLMLALKSIIAQATAIPTIIFDEVDTGVSGEIASKMGRIMRQLAHDFQILGITHLPQVAAAGQQHFFVSKSTHDNRTVTTVKALSPQERIHEIASMMSGEKLSVQAVENAKILLQNNI